MCVWAQAVNTKTKDGYKVVIVGGGSAGITTASHYARKLPGQVAVVEPSGGQRRGQVLQHNLTCCRLVRV